PDLHPHVAAGRVIPALLDLRNPILTGLDGVPLAITPNLVVANYVACVSPTSHLHKQGAGSWAELHTRIALKSSQVGDSPPKDVDALLDRWPDRTEDVMDALVIHHQYRPASLDTLEPHHWEIAADTLRALDEAALSYPYGFIDFMRAMPLAPGGAFLISDYQAQDDQVARGGFKQVRPQLYGDSINHPVYFSVFNGFARVQGWDCARTVGPARSLLQALVAPRIAPSTRIAFQELFGRGPSGIDLLDYAEAAQRFIVQGELGRACRFLDRACALDPLNSARWFELGTISLDAGYTRAALDAFRRCGELEGAEVLDWEFRLGCTHADLGRPRDAIHWFEQSLAKGPNPTTYANLGSLHLMLNDVEHASAWLQKALELSPDHPQARALWETAQELLG
ncbi:MAG: tetratricopeptide repeat protein, partial [Myxococcota bacterium]